MTVPDITLSYRQFALVDIKADISTEDVSALEKAGIKVIKVNGDPHRVFAPVNVYRTSGEM